MLLFARNKLKARDVAEYHGGRTTQQPEQVYIEAWPILLHNIGPELFAFLT